MKLNSIKREFYEIPKAKEIMIAIRADLMALSFSGHAESLDDGFESQSETFGETDGTW